MRWMCLYRRGGSNPLPRTGRVKLPFYNTNMPEKEIGKVTHWYDKIGVAVIKLSGPLKAGDQIKIRRGEEEFDADISSMQIDHESVSSAKKGDDIAIKLPQKTKEGAVVFLVK